MARVHGLRRVLAAGVGAAVLGLAAACGGASDDSALAEPEVATATLSLVGAQGAIEVGVEVADTVTERQRGLSGRDALDPQNGMLFVNDRDVTTGFQMANTLIPLSLAFIDDVGGVAQLVDMNPCEASPCEVFEPRAPYRYALEVNQGAFAAWGIVVGDRVVLPD